MSTDHPAGMSSAAAALATKTVPTLKSTRIVLVILTFQRQRYASQTRTAFGCCLVIAFESGKTALPAVAVRNWHFFGRMALVDQTRMDHRLAHGAACLVGGRHHWQSHVFTALADQRHRVLDRSGARLDEEIDMKGSELVLNFKRGREVPAQACSLELGAQARRY